MRIIDWSSDVCSSDLLGVQLLVPVRAEDAREEVRLQLAEHDVAVGHGERSAAAIADRKSVVWGKSVSVRVDLGGRRIINKKNNHDQKQRATNTSIRPHYVSVNYNTNIY